MYRRSLLFLGLAVSLVPATHAEGPFRIGLTLGLTGKYAELADMQMKSFKLWERDVNDRGGLLGRTVQLTILDDRSDPATAGEIYRRLIEDGKVDFVFAPYSSEITSVVAAITEKHRYPLLVTGAASEVLWQNGYGYLFGVSNTSSSFAAPFLEALVADGLDNIAIVNADDLNSRSVSKGAREWARRFGLNVVFVSEFAKGAGALEDIALKARASRAQVFMLCGHFEESVNGRLALKKIGWTPRAYFATVGPLLPKFEEVLKADAEGTFSGSQWEPDSPFVGAREFSASFGKTYGKAPSYQAVTCYAAGQVLETAVRNTRSLDRQKLRDNFSSLDTLTIMGRYGVDPSGKQIRQFTTVVQWQNGRKVIVAPKEMMSAKPAWK